MHIRTLTAAVLAAAIITAPLAATPTAQAQGTSPTATASDIAMSKNRCYHPPVDVEGLDSQSPDGSTIEVLDPHGDSVYSKQSIYSYSEYFNLDLCSVSATAGRYEIDVNGTPAGTFTVFKPRFKNYRVNGREMRTHLTFRANPLRARKVVLQLLYKGSWYEVLSEKTDKHGNAVVSCLPHKKCNFKTRWVYHDYVFSKEFQLTYGRLAERSAGDRIAPALARAALVAR